MEGATWCEQAFEWITSHWAFCAFIIGVVFEVPKWRFRPFTALFKWIGKAINRPVMDEIKVVDQKVDGLKSEIDKIKDDVKALNKTVDINEMDIIRSTVLEFANSCRNGRGHTKEEFDHIIALNDKYVALLDKYEIRNGVYEADYAFILAERDRCQRENSYLA